MKLRKKPARNRLVQTGAPRLPLQARARGLARRLSRHAAAFGVVAVLLGLASQGVRLLTTSPFFALKTLRMSGLHNITENDLRDRLPVTVGENLFLIDRSKVSQAVLQHPFVAQVKVSRVLPKTLHLQVVEREPAALVELDGLYLADRTGYVFKRATLAEAEGLLIVTGLSRDQYIDDPEGSRGLVREALDAAAQWGAERPPLSEVSAHPTYGLSLFLRAGGVEIRLGRGDLKRKFARYDALSRELAQRKERARAVYLDSTTRPDRVTVRLQPESEGG